jgi:hypothetical protein
MSTDLATAVNEIDRRVTVTVTITVTVTVTEACGASPTT